ncbi:MAG: PmoA family protein, partial [Rhodospirillales bacterium]|nr:PmoA family protein [Rhodospirillales bacterium]
AVVGSMVAAGFAPKTPLKLRVEDKTVTILDGQQVLATYYRQPNAFKPYLQQLYTPTGIQPLFDSPHDHIHHHALMFAVQVDGKTFWNEYPNTSPGKQQPRPDKVVAAELPSGQARLVQTLDWIDHAGARRLVEERAVTVHGVVDAATLLTWQSELSPPGERPAKLDGAHYEGLGMRFVREFNGRTAFLHASGKPGEVFRGDERLTPGKWCAVQGTVEGRKVTAAMFDHPDNPLDSTVWFTMSKPFAYLSATLKLHEKPIVIEADESLTLRYGVALWDGHIDAAAIDPLCEKWLKITDSTDNPGN